MENVQFMMMEEKIYLMNILINGIILRNVKMKKQKTIEIMQEEI